MVIGVTVIQGYVMEDGLDFLYRYHEGENTADFFKPIFRMMLGSGDIEKVICFMSERKEQKKNQNMIISTMECFCRMIGTEYEEVYNLDNRLAVALCPIDITQQEQLAIKQYLENKGHYIICDTSRHGIRTSITSKAVSLSKVLLSKADVIFNISAPGFHCEIQEILLEKYMPTETKVIDVDWEEVMGDAERQ